MPWLTLTLYRPAYIFKTTHGARRPADPRYGDFFAYMVDRDMYENLAMPADVRVITWNYDDQFEKSFADYFEHPDHRREVGSMLQVTPATGTSADHYDDIFSIYRLNGAAGIRKRSDQLTHYFNAFVQDRRNLSAALRLTLHFYRNVSSVTDFPYLQFAWENDTRRANILDHIVGFSPVETVVVIGYSFPIFNRRLDREVFEALRPKEVFLQVAGDNAVTDRLVGVGIKRELIKVVGDRNQFFIPYSYSPHAWMSRWAKRAH